MSYYAAGFTCQPEKFDQIYTSSVREKLSSLCHLHPNVITPATFEQELPALKNVEVIFSTWGMLTLSEAQLDQLPKLKIIFYAAGATDYFSAPFIARGIKIVSAWKANAVPVAEFCLAQILLACKGYFHNLRNYNRPEDFHSITADYPAPGIYGERIALIGAGAISQVLAELLTPFALEVVTIPSRQERRDISLEAAFSTSFVVSNHLPNRPDNIGVLNGDLFRLMRPGAVFINTGRGLQVNEKDLIDVFSERTDLTALLDVTKPEPPLPGSPLYDMPNVLLTSHIAGALNNETRRLADCVVEEFQRWINGVPLNDEITGKA
ncbi:hydroxyacid dehydrogenase [Pectobacterium polonicum]|uniref:hydroxyacid dehydrogenase n=1 Tax=Pectobacterium polonicum TaxID=2485124 RepID=UPI002B256438|nr:hydroxyacid dehydrogenase [Pectobacterium polonicum]